MKKKNRKFKFTLQSTLIVVLFCFSLLGCKVTNKIYEENDIVYSTKRIELKLDHHLQNQRSPLTYAKQSIVKEISENGTVYKVFDALILTSLSYQVEDKVYIIIDNEFFAMEIDKKEYEHTREIVEQKEDIATSDSTSISVVTGYSENNRKITRFSYKLPDNVIKKIKNTNRVLFRYYSGPDMMTITLDGRKLKKLKQLIDRI